MKSSPPWTSPDAEKLADVPFVKGAAEDGESKLLPCCYADCRRNRRRRDNSDSGDVHDEPAKRRTGELVCAMCHHSFHLPCVGLRRHHTAPLRGVYVCDECVGPLGDLQLSAARLRDGESRLAITETAIRGCHQEMKELRNQALLLHDTCRRLRRLNSLMVATVAKRLDIKSDEIGDEMLSGSVGQPAKEVTVSGTNSPGGTVDRVGDAVTSGEECGVTESCRDVGVQADEAAGLLNAVNESITAVVEMSESIDLQESTVVSDIASSVVPERVSDGASVDEVTCSAGKVEVRHVETHVHEALLEPLNRPLPAQCSRSKKRKTAGTPVRSDVAVQTTASLVLKLGDVPPTWFFADARTSLPAMTPGRGRAVVYEVPPGYVEVGAAASTGQVFERSVLNAHRLLESYVSAVMEAEPIDPMAEDVLVAPEMSLSSQGAELSSPHHSRKRHLDQSPTENLKRYQIRDNIRSGSRTNRGRSPIPAVNKLDMLEDDRLLYCHECDDRYLGFCQLHGFSRVFDSQVAITDHWRALRSCPKQLAIKQKGSWENWAVGHTVTAMVPLPKATIFGPIVGKVHHDFNKVIQSELCWKIKHKYNHSWCVDTRDPSTSNWMRYVPFAQCRWQLNLEAFQNNNEIYFRTTQDIPAGNELAVWYGEDYFNSVMVPLLWNPDHYRSLHMRHKQLNNGTFTQSQVQRK